MRAGRLGALLLFGLALALTPAQARQHHRHFHRARQWREVGWAASSNVERARARGLPWCGAFMADLEHIGGTLARSLWLARNWAHVGTATSPHVGAIVVWRHHVGKITGRENGQWIVLSGNDGHRVRERPRSLRGAIAFRDYR